jgi:quercetin dioxygenase-like cupin family protein
MSFSRVRTAGIIVQTLERDTMKRLLAAAAIITLALTAAASAQPVPSPVQPAPVKRTMLGKVEVPGANTDVITALVEIAPGFKAGRHSHPGTVQGQVLEGEFWYAIDGQPEKVAKAGEFLEIRDAAIHNEGAQGSTPSKLLVIYIVERGKPLVSPVK